MKRIEVYIISGFLGSGKTTLLKELMHRCVCENGHTIILENEFGKIDFDGEALALTGVDVESVVAECICCGGAETMLDKLRAFKTKGLSRLFVEPSGVARLSDVRRIFSYPDIREFYELKCVLAIIDACNGFKWNKIAGVLFENQIRFSDVVYVSKKDLVTACQLTEIKKLITSIKPDASILDNISGIIEWNNGKINKPNLIYERAENMQKIEVCSVTLDGIISKSGLQSFFEKMKTGYFGKVFRLKGILRMENGCCSVDGVAETITNIFTDNKVPNSRISFIGMDLKKELIENELKELSR